jgi:NAD+ synthase (glutamine-hydrolysing)
MSTPGLLRVALAQVNTTVGDLSGNRALVEEAYREAIRAGASLIVLPELTLTGYPPEDLLLKPSFLEDTRHVLEQLCPRIMRGLLVVGFADVTPAGVHNATALIGGGKIRDIYHKCTLPNYGVFDEKRYFVPGTRCPVYEIGPWRIAVNICEDIWFPGGVPALQCVEGNANLMLNLSASPYNARKGKLREKLITEQARRLALPVLQTNLTGGQDELVFDGQSLAADAAGQLIARAPQFAPHILIIDIPVPEPVKAQKPGTQRRASPKLELPTPGAEMILLESRLTLERVRLPALRDELRVSSPARIANGRAATRGSATAEPASERISINRIWPELGDEAEVYRALMSGLRDYVRKNSFKGVVLGLSGGIDSALTAVIAADALDHEAVVGISMPSEYSSETSQEGARVLARNLAIEFREVPIMGMVDQTLQNLRPLLRNSPPDVTEENIQARIRGMVLMAFSNRFGHLVLATGNKSEVAVGYCTLYGDMVGGFSVLKDVLKTQVYRLACWRNEQTPQTPPIPRDTLDRPPSAELRPDQRDSDSLPPYEVLDPVVKALVEEDAHPRDVVAAGFERELVDRIFRMIQANEYKRRQAAPGIRITPRAFGKDRRYPLTNRYRPRET